MTLVKAEAKKGSTLFLGKSSLKVINFLLKENESVSVSAHSVLAFEPSLKWDIVSKSKGISGMIVSGLFNIKFEGPGWISVNTYMDPLTIPVKKNVPVYCNPRGVALWSGNVQSEVKTEKINVLSSVEDVQLMFTLSSGESGFVVLNSPFYFILKNSSLM